jgi:hypothetical protein
MRAATHRNNFRGSEERCILQEKKRAMIRGAMQQKLTMEDVKLLFEAFKSS